MLVTEVLIIYEDHVLVYRMKRFFKLIIYFFLLLARR